MFHDLVVDSKARGKGAGKALTEAALEHAAKAGARVVDLTSKPKPERAVAIRMYKNMGFTLYETEAYRYRFNRSGS